MLINEGEDLLRISAGLRHTLLCAFCMSGIPSANVEVGVRSRICPSCLFQDEGPRGTLRSDLVLEQ